MTKDYSKHLLPMGFTTSINVVKKVLNIPLSTIKNELHKNNYSIKDDSSNCIDEKMLERFAEQYKKRLKRYFTSSVENLSYLTPEEYSDFVDFCKTFSKNSSITFNWRQIDKDAIQETFFLEIQEATNTRPKLDISKESLLALLDAFVCRSVDSLPVFDVKALVSSLFNNLPKTDDSLFSHVEYKFKPKSLKQQISVLNRVKHNKYYRSKITRKTPSHQFVSKQQRNFFACLRWHIIPDDGNSDDNFMKIA